ncbi:MAG: electron transfer flavoprotein subunit alpha/FixB family protein [Chloroflexota bacterium]
MTGRVWAIGEPEADGMTRLSTEVATLARRIAEAAGREAVGLVVEVDAGTAATRLADFVPRVIAVDAIAAADRPWAAVAAPLIAEIVGGDGPAWIVIGATPDGHDLAGMLAVLLDAGVLSTATDAAWDPTDGLVVEMSVLGGRAITSCTFTGDRGIVVLRPNAVDAEPAPAPGSVERSTATAAAMPTVTIIDRVASDAGAVPIEEARIIVTGGRGVGGPGGFDLVAELAELLGGTVGATRAAVDSGWIPYARQVGQTGKTVKPALYLALGVSGALQHKVGMQTAGAIVAVNRDPDAPLAAFADLYVVGDLFEVGPALAAELRSRRG